MKNIPMNWKGADHIKNHFVGSCKNNEGDTVITYRWWNRVKQRWQYKAEIESLLLLEINFEVKP